MHAVYTFSVVVRTRVHRIGLLRETCSTTQTRCYHLQAQYILVRIQLLNVLVSHVCMCPGDADRWVEPWRTESEFVRCKLTCPLALRRGSPLINN